jgi:tetratricopeptide (TPR) repeat protein
LSGKLIVQKNFGNSFSFAIVLLLVLFFGILSPTWAQSPEHLQSFDISPLQKGEFFLLGKKPGEALKIFQDLWQKEPQNSYAVRGIVRSHQALKKLPEAVSFLNKYLEKNSQSSSATYGVGYAFYLQGRFEESRKALGESLNFDQENALALNNMAAVLIELKEYASALTQVKEAIRIAPNELMFYRNLQMIYVGAGTPEKFEKEYRHLRAEDSSAQAKRYGLVLAQQLRQKSFKLYANGKIDKTISIIVYMLDLYREINHKPGIVAGLFSLAVLYEEQGKVELALEKYQEVLKINPQHIQAREKLRSLRLKRD